MLMGDVLGEDLRGHPYAMRLKRLRARGVGLWDVIESAQREGSLDGAIRAAELRAIAARVAAHVEGPYRDHAEELYGENGLPE